MITSRGLCRLVIGMLVLVAGLSGAGREAPVAHAANAKPQTIPALRELTWETAYGRGYQIQTSADGSDWTTIFTTTTGDGGVDDLTTLTGTGRFVRMQGTQRATQWGFSLFELEVYTP